MSGVSSDQIDHLIYRPCIRFSEKMYVYTIQWIIFERIDFQKFRISRSFQKYESKGWYSVMLITGLTLQTFENINPKCLIFENLDLQKFPAVYIYDRTISMSASTYIRTYVKSILL